MCIMEWVNIAPVYCVYFIFMCVCVCVWVCVQACRGIELDDGIEVETDCADSSEDEGVYECQAVPNETVVAYATAPGKKHTYINTPL